MTEGRQETRGEEVARVRSYLASQVMRRTPEQLVEALREAHGQFLEATAAIPDAVFSTPPRELPSTRGRFPPPLRGANGHLMCVM